LSYAGGSPERRGLYRTRFETSRAGPRLRRAGSTPPVYAQMANDRQVVDRAIALLAKRNEALHHSDPPHYYAERSGEKFRLARTTLPS